MLINFEPGKAVRVTVHDGRQTVSFLTARDTALRLVAGCAVNPGTLAELLLATEVYQRGISAALMGALMEFDKAWHREGRAYLQRTFAPEATPDTPPEAFEVVDEWTETVAHAPADGGLVVINLPVHHISVSGEVEVPAEGQVLVHTATQLTQQTITYILPQAWEIERSA